MTKEAVFAIKSTMYALVAALLLVGNCIEANAQATGLRTPLIQGAPNAAAGEAPMQGDPPPVGSGSTPMGVTPGMTSGYAPPPSDVPMPPMSPLDRGSGGGVNSYVQPFLTPPPSTPGVDPGMLPTPLSGASQAAVQVNINPGGGYPGDQAPQTRTGRQTSRDFGLARTNGSTLTDFGELLINKQVKVQPQFSQDGPRAVQTTTDGSGNTRNPNLSGAQTTQDLHGNRTLFKGANLRARATIAPY
ncbi:MAG TPA: hypothetical protein V6C76_10655 [Drouetiella sp.]